MGSVGCVFALDILAQQLVLGLSRPKEVCCKLGATDVVENVLFRSQLLFALDALSV